MTTPLSGTRLNAGRVIILHGPPSAGQSTAVKRVLEEAAAGVFAYDVDAGGSTAAERETALHKWLDETKDKRFHYVVIASGDQSRQLAEALPLAKHIFISPGAEELRERHAARAVDKPAKGRINAEDVYSKMLADPLYSSMEPIGDAVVWLSEYTSALQRDAGRAPLAESEMLELISSDAYAEQAKGASTYTPTDDEIKRALTGAVDDTSL